MNSILIIVLAIVLIILLGIAVIVFIWNKGLREHDPLRPRLIYTFIMCCVLILTVVSYAIHY